jgi:hypothetical protein
MRLGQLNEALMESGRLVANRPLAKSLRRIA